MPTYLFTIKFANGREEMYELKSNGTFSNMDAQSFIAGDYDLEKVKEWCWYAGGTITCQTEV